jgi:hypothetical protein
MTIGWIGNILIAVGLWGIGSKKRSAFLWSIVGESVWVFYSLTIGMYDLAAICVVFALLALRNWIKWGKP